MNASSVLANAYSDAFGPPPGSIEVTVDHALLEHSVIRASAGTAIMAEPSCSMSIRCLPPIPSS